MFFFCIFCSYCVRNQSLVGMRDKVSARLSILVDKSLSCSGRSAVDDDDIENVYIVTYFHISDSSCLYRVNY